jgi:hypothetical protein
MYASLSTAHWIKIEPKLLSPFIGTQMLNKYFCNTLLFFSIIFKIKIKIFLLDGIKVPYFGELKYKCYLVKVKSPNIQTLT